MPKFVYKQRLGGLITCEDILEIAKKLAYSSVGKFKTPHESSRLLIIVQEIEAKNEKLEMSTHHRYYKELERMHAKCIQRQNSAYLSR